MYIPSMYLLEATHSSILAWKIPYTEPGRLQPMGSQGVGHDSNLAHTDSKPVIWGFPHTVRYLLTLLHGLTSCSLGKEVLPMFTN